MKYLCALIVTLLFSVACAPKQSTDQGASTAPVEASATATPDAAPDGHVSHSEHAEHAEHAEGQAHGHGHEKAACGCTVGKAGGTAWCDGCNVGYINGEKTKDKSAYDAATAEADEAPAE